MLAMLLYSPIRYSFLLNKVELGGKEIDLQRLLEAMNLRIEALFDREHMLGHAYFMTGELLQSVFENKVIPLLSEYFFEDWSKVRAVLADDQVDDESLQFVKAVEINSNLLKGRKSGRNKYVYHINHDALTSPAAYQKIYENLV